MSMLTRPQLEFLVFCIENYADKYNLDAKKVYNAFKENDNYIKNYIINNFDVLHTQGKNYIVDDLNRVLNEKGIKI